MIARRLGYPPAAGSAGGISRRGLLLGAAACAVSAAAGVTGDRMLHPSPPELRPGEITRTRAQRIAAQPDAVFRVGTDDAVVGLSFDDGPDPRYTPQVLDLLDRYGAKATFFLVGVNALAYPDLVRRIVSSGHGVGNHTLDHPELQRLGLDQIRVEINGAEQAIARAGGGHPHLFRPPKGYTDRAVGVIADSGKYTTCFWTECVEAYYLHVPNLREAVTRMMAGVGPGSIILAHDGGRILTPRGQNIDRTRTVQCLPFILQALRRRGLRAVGLDILLKARETQSLLT